MKKKSDLVKKMLQIQGFHYSISRGDSYTVPENIGIFHDFYMHRTFANGFLNQKHT